MSLRYTVDNLKKMREAAGLGTLSMGICALSGELVSSTPIPGSRHGEERHGTADYGGYLLGEGMTREVALYLGNLHNHFPELAKAVERQVFDLEDGDFLPRVREIAIKHGWSILEGALDGWIDEHLVDITYEEQPDLAAAVKSIVTQLYNTLEENKAIKRHNQEGTEIIRRLEAMLAEVKADFGNVHAKWSEARSFLAAIDAAKAGEPPMPDPDATVSLPQERRQWEVWGRQGWDAAAALRVEVEALKDACRSGDRCIHEMKAHVEDRVAQATLAERERIIHLLDLDPTVPVCVCHFDRGADEMVGEVLGTNELSAILAPRKVAP